MSIRPLGTPPTPFPLKTAPRFFALTRTPLAPTPATSPEEEKRRAEALKAAQDFEAIFMAHLLKTMRSSMVPKGGFLKQTFASNTYQQLFDEELSTQLAHGKGLGLSEMLYREFMRQENR